MPGLLRAAIALLRPPWEKGWGTPPNPRQSGLRPSALPAGARFHAIQVAPDRGVLASLDKGRVLRSIRAP